MNLSIWLVVLLAFMGAVVGDNELLRRIASSTVLRCRGEAAHHSTSVYK